MRILLTNDDGVSAPGIILLAKALRLAGHRVFVVAPDRDRSGVSHSISFLRDPCKLIEMETDTWSCSGTPADCVVVGLLGGIPELYIPKDESPLQDACPPDLVLSGINRGANIGTDILYSGTAAGARQGSFIDIPAIALSLVMPDMEYSSPEEWRWEMAVAFVMEHLAEMRQYWKPGTFVNVNIPNTAGPASAMVPAFPALRYYKDRIYPYDAPGGGRFCFAKIGRGSAKSEPGSDWDVVSKDQVAISVVFIHPVALEEVRERGEKT